LKQPALSFSGKKEFVELKPKRKRPSAKTKPKDESQEPQDEFVEEKLSEKEEEEENQAIPKKKKKSKSPELSDGIDADIDRQLLAVA
jgi:hypothetical protein